MKSAAALRAMAGQPSLTSLRGTSRACPAEAREASEGWWSQAGSNRRPLACHASALPAELWPLSLPVGRILVDHSRPPSLVTRAVHPFSQIRADLKSLHHLRHH